MQLIVLGSLALSAYTDAVIAYLPSHLPSVVACAVRTTLVCFDHHRLWYGASEVITSFIGAKAPLSFQLLDFLYRILARLYSIRVRHHCPVFRFIKIITLKSFPAVERNLQ